MLGLLRISVLLVWPVLLLTGMSPQDRVADVRSKFARESDPVQKAKMMIQLATVEFQEAQRLVDNGNFPDALEVVRKYRDEAQACQDGLDAKRVDPEKHFSGFKQLQVSLRESLRRLDALLANMSRDEQKPFLDIRKEIDQMDQHLIHELFPRQPNGSPKASKPKP